MKPDEIPPGTHVEPNPENPWPVAEVAKADGTPSPLLTDRDQEHRVPKLNLLTGNPLDEPAPVAAPVAPAAEAVAVPGDVVKKRNMTPWWIGVAVVILVLAGGTGYLIVSKHKAAPVAVASPRPTPSASATPSPSPSPSPTPSPSPSPSATPAPQTVTVPTVAPTSSHPQSVTITSKSGLWLRSSPTSVNQSNVIGWMPDGAQISVDSTGSFWWHGIYNGKAGYFASKYTQ